jgi:hypothetical protein
MKKTFTALKTAADAVGLSVNQEKKNKYMVENCKSFTPHTPHIHISDYNFERVSRFVYLGSLVNETNDIKEETSKRIQNANRCYYGLFETFLSYTSLLMNPNAVYNNISKTSSDIC